MKKVVFLIFSFFLSINIIYAKEKVEFSKCVDGDTIKIKLNGKEETLRFLAVDTPESVHPNKGIEYYGKDASNYTCDLATNAKKIEIEYDKASDKKDKYDRLLVWVFVDGELLQDLLVSNGYAEVAYLYGDYKYTELLESHQEEAKTKKLGIWNSEKEKEFNEKNNVVTDDNSVNNDSKDEKNTEISTTELILILGLVIILALLSKNKNVKKAKKIIKKLK